MLRCGLATRLSVSALFLCLTASPLILAADLDAGVDAYLAGDYESAMKILYPLAKATDEDTAGDFIAQYFVGEMYYYGQGVPENFHEAIKWYRLSAAQNDPDAQYSIGYMYDTGKGVIESQEEAKQWYMLAASQEHAQAQVGLANILLEHSSSDHDVTEALAWLRNAASLNNTYAQFRLGQLYESGDLVNIDLNEAIRWYQYAVAQGDLDSLQAINRIRSRDDFVESYPQMLRRLGISRPDADALFCENASWMTAYGYLLDADESSDRRLLDFSNTALKAIARFRATLNKQLDLEGYSENPGFREVVREIGDLGKAVREDIQERIEAADSVGHGDLALLNRAEGGVFDLVYHDGFLAHMDTMTDNELYGLWDYCTSTYMPSGLLRPNIGLNKLLAAERGESTARQVYYSAVDYGTGVVDWSKTKYERIKEIDVCDGDLDFLGGVATGTAITSMAAAESVTAIGTAASTMILGESALMVITSSSVFVATAPAIATGVTVAAVAGATVFATAKGYCFFFANPDDELAEEVSQTM
jgi:TPR repeat protein